MKWFFRISLGILLTLVVLFFFYQKEMLQIGQIYVVKSELDNYYSEAEDAKEIVNNKDLSNDEKIAKLKENNNTYSFLFLTQIDKKNTCLHQKKALNLITNPSIAEALLVGEIYQPPNCMKDQVLYKMTLIEAKKHESNILTDLAKIEVDSPANNLSKKLYSPLNN